MAKPIVIAQTEELKIGKQKRSCNCKLQSKKWWEKGEQKIFESDEYIQQDNGDLDYLEERYSSLKIPYVIRRVVDDYIACLESRDERYADMSYVAGMGDAISLLIKWEC